MGSRSDIAISVRGLSKAYTIAHNQERHITLAETLLARLKNPFKRTEKETFWALRDVSFDVKKGEVVGIIGRNGAGKSTLLKILSRITEPTKGEIDLYGRVGSLLEVGTGFHYELTGRENVYLNGAILGMSRREISKQFDAIVDFAEVEKFLDTPVKRYSSGMFVRLAFSVAAHLNPEILIVDEVLAVGDAEFQKKCLNKMRDVSAAGRTVLFVSHNIGVIRSLCQRGIVLSSGSVLFNGTADAAADEYVAQIVEAGRQNVADRMDRSGRGTVRMVGIQAHSKVDEGAGVICVGGATEIVFQVTGWRSGCIIHLVLCDVHGHALAFCTTMNPSDIDNFKGADEELCEIVWRTEELRLMPASYTVNAAIYRDSMLEDGLDGAITFDVEAGIIDGRTYSYPCSHGNLILPHSWSVRIPAAVCTS